MRKIFLILYIFVNLFICDVCLAQSENQSAGDNNETDSLKTRIIEHSEANKYQPKGITGNVETKHPVFQTSGSSEVISHDKFNKYENRNLSEILQEIPALYGAYGDRGETSFYVRGFNQRQVPVLLDGVPIYVPFDGLIGLDRINSANIQNITIVKSAPSVVYGPNTMGGVINIKTEKPSEPLKLRVSIDDNQLRKLNQSLYLGSKFDNNIYLTFNQSMSRSNGFNLSNDFRSSLNEDGGIRDNSNYHNLNLGGSIGYSSSEEQDYQLSYNFFSSPWEVPLEVGVAKPRYWRFTEWRKNTAIFNFKHPIRQNTALLNGSIFYDKYYNVLDAYDNRTFSSQTKKYAFHSIYDDYSIGFSFFPQIVINKYVKLTPVCLYKRDIHGETPDYNVVKAKYSVSTTTFGGEIQFEPVSKVSINLGTALNRYNPIYNNGNSLRDTLIAWDHQGEISYLIKDNNKLFFGIGRKTRFPTLKELYSGYIGRNIPNSDLMEETALRYETGYSGILNKNSTVNISLFRDSIDNLIVDVPLGGNIYQNQNINKSDIQGIDTNLEVNLLKNKMSLKLGYVYTDAVNKSDKKTSDALAYIPKNKFFTGITLSLPFGMSTDVSLVYTGKTNYQDNADMRWKELNGYTVLNIGLLKKFKDRCIVFLNIHNLLDRNYETFNNYPMQGINISIGSRVEM